MAAACICSLPENLGIHESLQRSPQIHPNFRRLGCWVHSLRLFSLLVLTSKLSALFRKSLLQKLERHFVLPNPTHNCVHIFCVDKDSGGQKLFYVRGGFVLN